MFKLFNTDKTPSSELIELLFDVAANNRYPSLEAYFKDKKLKVNLRELNAFTKLLEKKMFIQISYFAHLMYYHMELSGDWGEPGEQQVKIAFCRNLIKLPTAETLSEEHAEQFVKTIAQNLEKLKITGMAESVAAAQLKNFKFNLWGRFIDAYKSTEIARILKFSGSQKIFHGGQYGSSQEFILGDGKKTHKQGYDIFYLSKEIIRTPNIVMSMAAIIGHQSIYMRLESLKTIFAQKWVYGFDYSDEERRDIENKPVLALAEGIKDQVLAGYHIKTKEDLIRKQTLFLNDMAETILYHELGHGIMQHELIPLELGAIGEATKLYGENIYTAFLEFLADFSPPNKDLLGPIHNMLVISKSDLPRATRMYYMYMSDTWFYNTEDTYMYTYSDLMTLILIKYINPDKSIDFLRLERDLVFNPKKSSGEPLSLFEKVHQLFITDIEEIKTIIEHAQFKLSDSLFDYKNTRRLLVEEFIKNDGFVNEESYEFLVPFWTNMLGYVQKISDSQDKLLMFITNQEKKNLIKMMILSCGRKKAEAYQFDHRKFITDHMQKLGFASKE